MWFHSIQAPGDVSKVNPADNDVLQYDSTTRTWLLKQPSALGVSPAYGIDQFVATDAQVAFPTSASFVAYSALVILNGIIQKKDTSYTEDGDLQGVTFATGLVLISDEVEVRYAKS